MKPWAVILLILSLIVIVVSVFGSRKRRSKAPSVEPADPSGRAHRDAAPRSTVPGAPPAPAPAGAAPAPMARAAVPNWNAVGAITGVLGLVVSIIGLFGG